MVGGTIVSPLIHGSAEQTPAEMAHISAGVYLPLYKTPGAADRVEVQPFYLDIYAVTRPENIVGTRGQVHGQLVKIARAVLENIETKALQRRCSLRVLCV